MNIGVLGTGSVGRTISARLVELGHSIVIGTREPSETLARTESDRMGNPPLSAWLEQNPKVRLGTFAEAAAHGEIVMNATNGNGSLDALKAAGEANLNGKTLIDIQSTGWLERDAAVVIH